MCVFTLTNVGVVCDAFIAFIQPCNEFFNLSVITSRNVFSNFSQTCNDFINSSASTSTRLIVIGLIENIVFNQPCTILAIQVFQVLELFA